MNAGETAYGTTELPKEKREKASDDETLRWSLALFVFAITSATYYFWALLPAWEADQSLGWTKSHTLTVNWATNVAQACGLLLAGPFSDHVEPLQLMALEAAVTMLGLVLVLFWASPEFMVADLVVVSFVKGIEWPAVGSIISQTVPLDRQDSYFFTCALAARLSGAFGDFALGQLLRWSLSWHEALSAVGGLFLVCFLAALPVLKRTPAADVHKDLEMAARTPEGYGEKLRRLVSDSNGWLALLVLLGTSGLWGLAGYLSVLLKQQFSLSSGESAMAASSLLSGTFVGLLLAGLFSFLKGRNWGRMLQLIQATIGLMALILIVCMPRMPLVPYIICLAATGVGAGPVMYLPYCIYSASVPRSQRAFCMGVLDSCCQVTTSLALFVFGRLRISMPRMAGEVMYTSAAFGFAVTTVSAALLYLRLYRVQGHF